MAERPQTAKIMLVLMLVAVLAFVLLRQFDILSFGSDNANAAKSQDGQTGDQSVSDQGKNGQTSPPTFRPQWARPAPAGPVINDPMYIEPREEIQPEQADAPLEEAAEPEFRVGGIVHDVENPSASSVIVDGQILHIGDTIHGAEVIEISDKHCELRRGDKTWTIRPGQNNKEPQ